MAADIVEEQLDAALAGRTSRNSNRLSPMIPVRAPTAAAGPVPDRCRRHRGRRRRGRGQAAQNIITAFVRIDGRPAGVIANQPLVLSGAIDARCSDKAAHFIQVCDDFGLPLIFVVDTPGVLPGVDEERNGVIKRGGRFFFAVLSATVPIVTIVIRKAYGGAYAVMGAESAVSIVGRQRIAAAGENAATVRQHMIDTYNSTVATPWIAAERGYIDAVIEPAATRLEVRKALNLLRTKVCPAIARKHTIYPL
ncbi:hypothetical protein IU500_33445 [Nocardia terpenica]|nr:hypothetical protein [Nocardia terpenica]MBF6108926.1 hypothetical protein [Nocardia terpenica]MBF6121769.1 hypothetical protein [Nocardia terpenica]